MLQVSGSISSLSGDCPNRSFSIGRTHIVTDVSTTYHNGECKNLKNKKKVTVSGVETDGKLLATSIDFAVSNNEDEN
jgi:hypothetical protein